MVKKVLSVSCISIKLVAFIVCICMVSEVSAALVTGSSGSATIIGNDANHTTGSFKVQVDYAVYDGTSASDPFGVTTDKLQIAFTLSSILGGDGELPALNFGRFTVYAPDSHSTVPFYTGTKASGAGEAPHDYQWNWDPDYGLIDIDGTLDGMYLELPTYDANDDKWYGSNNAQFIFLNSDTTLADFAPGQTSMQLALTVARGDLPANLHLEIDRTDASYPIHGEALDVEFVPEPASVALFGIGSFLLSLWRRRKT